MGEWEGNFTASREAVRIKNCIERRGRRLTDGDVKDVLLMLIQPAGLLAWQTLPLYDFRSQLNSSSLPLTSNTGTISINRIHL